MGPMFQDFLRMDRRSVMRSLRYHPAAIAVAMALWLCLGSTAAMQSDADQKAVLTALDRYERTATTGSLLFSSVDAFTSALDAAVPAWISQVPEPDRARRQKLAVLFVLDLSWSDLKGPEPFGLHRLAMLEWGCKVLRREPPTEFARTWMLVSHALLEPAWSAFGDIPNPVREHLGHARKLFPSDSRLRFVELLFRPAVVNLSNRPGANAGKLARSGAGRIALARQLGVLSYTLDVTLKDLQPLLDDAIVGPEVQAHIGIIKFHKNQLAESIQDLTAAAHKTTDPFVQNLSWLFVGLAYDAQHRDADATAAYERAVLAVPGAKSSAMALASHWFTAGRRDEASELLDRAFTVDVPVLDPWQHISDMLRFVPGWMAKLHAEVGHPAAVSAAAPVTFAPNPDQPRRIDSLARYADWQPDSRGLPVFRATGAAVLVDVSVRNGKQPVGDLRPADFEVLDNGVLQQVDSISADALPIDLTMVADYYDATAGEETNPFGPSYMDEQRTALRADVSNIAKLLSKRDRIRIIFVDNEPREMMAMQSPGLEPPQTNSKIGHLSYGRNSAVYDAVALALMKATPMGRRHLVLAFTEGADDGSILTKERVTAVASSADAVMHLSKRLFNRTGYPTMLWSPDPQALPQLASITGGTLLNSLGGSKYRDIQGIVDRLRQSYVLRYQPSGVASPGWHQIQVKLKRPGKFDIQSRKGYWGG
jgi:hypothetical protein